MVGLIEMEHFKGCEGSGREATSPAIPASQAPRQPGPIRREKCRKLRDVERRTPYPCIPRDCTQAEVMACPNEAAPLRPPPSPSVT